jgi:hypothetical protein
MKKICNRQRPNTKPKNTEMQRSKSIFVKLGWVGGRKDMGRRHKKRKKGLSGENVGFGRYEDQG